MSKNTTASFTIRIPCRGQFLCFKSEGFTAIFEIIERRDREATIGLSHITEGSQQAQRDRTLVYNWNRGDPIVKSEFERGLLAFAPHSCWTQDMGGGYTIELSSLCDMGKGWTRALHEEHHCIPC
jgi:hypothetical protein